jgi:hypothetical protein
MRRILSLSLLVVAFVVAVTGCSSSAQSKKTLTEIVTVTGTSATSTGSAGGSITVVSPGGATGAQGTATTGAPTSSSAPKTSKATTKSTSAAPTTTGKLVKVDPLKANCTQLLDAQDIKRITGATIPSSVTRIVDVAKPSVGRTGLLRCRYGATTGALTAPVSVALATYTTPAAADKQIAATISGLPGTDSKTTVAGYPAHIVIGGGGLLVMRYDNWTLSVAIQNKLVPDKELPSDLTQLATVVLVRVLKTG